MAAASAHAPSDPAEVALAAATGVAEQLPLNCTEEIRAHRVILAANSKFFESVLQANEPVIQWTGSPTLLRSIVKCFYEGTLRLPQNNSRFAKLVELCLELLLPQEFVDELVKAMTARVKNARSTSRKQLQIVVAAFIDFASKFASQWPCAATLYRELSDAIFGFKHFNTEIHPSTLHDILCSRNKIPGFSIVPRLTKYCSDRDGVDCTQFRPYLMAASQHLKPNELESVNLTKFGISDGEKSSLTFMARINSESSSNIKLCWEGKKRDGVQDLEWKMPVPLEPVPHWRSRDQSPLGPERLRVCDAITLGSPDQNYVYELDVQHRGTLKSIWFGAITPMCAEKNPNWLSEHCCVCMDNSVDTVGLPSQGFSWGGKMQKQHNFSFPVQMKVSLDGGKRFVQFRSRRQPTDSNERKEASVWDEWVVAREQDSAPAWNLFVAVGVQAFRDGHGPLGQGMHCPCQLLLKRIPASSRQQ